MHDLRCSASAHVAIRILVVAASICVPATGRAQYADHALLRVPHALASTVVLRTAPSASTFRYAPPPGPRQSLRQHVYGGAVAGLLVGAAVLYACHGIADGAPLEGGGLCGSPVAPLAIGAGVGALVGWMWWTATSPSAALTDHVRLP